MKSEFAKDDPVELPDKRRGVVIDVTMKAGSIKYPYQYLTIKLDDGEVVGINGYKCNDPVYLDEIKAKKDLKIKG